MEPIGGGIYKFNADGALLKFGEIASLGGMVWHFKHELVAAFPKHVKLVTKPLVVELLANKRGAYIPMNKLVVLGDSSY